MREIFAEIGTTSFPADEMKMGNAGGTGCSDMGDSNCIMPSIHPHIYGSEGPSHSSEFYIVDPYTACVVSAKIQAGVTAKLLENNAAKGNAIIEKAGSFPSISEFLETIDKLWRL